MEKTIGFVVTAGHLDIEWYQPMGSYRFWTVEGLEALKDIAREREDFACYLLDGQVFPLEEYLEVAPGDEAAMRELIASGKLAVGPFYTQFDEWLPSAESMMRNCLFGKLRSEAWGGRMCAGYLPDNFGHPLQLPQILRGFGIDSLMFMRGMPEILPDHPDEFLYQGLDGSRVLVSHFRESYSGAFDIFKKPVLPPTPREVPYYADYLSFEHHQELADHDDPARIAKSMIANVRRIAHRYPSRVVPLIAGYDHLPPQRNVGDSVAAANAAQDEITFVMGTPEQYVRLVQARLIHPAVYDMELIGSKYQYVLLGALSTRGYLKRENFAAEALLERYAEPLEAMAAAQGYPVKPQLLTEAWEKLLINSAHDSIHGSSVDEVHVEMRARFARARQIAAGLIHDCLKFAARKMAPLPAAHQAVAYAPVSGLQVGEVWLPVGDEPVRIVDRAGNPLPTQVLPRERVETNGRGQPRNGVEPGPIYRKVLFSGEMTAGEVAAYGAQAAQPDGRTDLFATDTYLENQFLRAEIDGALVHLWDKRTDTWHRNLNLLVEEADAGDAWDFSPPWTPGETVLSTQGRFTSRLASAGPVRATVEVSGRLSVPARLVGDQRSCERVEMPVRFELSLNAATPRLDVRLTLDNTARDHRVRLHVPTGMVCDRVLSQGHLAVISRPVAKAVAVEKWLQPPTAMMPFREWAALSDGRTGLAVAIAGVYDYEPIVSPVDNACTLAFTLVRGVGMMGRLNTRQRAGGASGAYRTPDAQCPGEQVVDFAYLPYAPDPEDEAPFLPLAQGFLYPPVVHFVRDAFHPQAGEDAALPAPYGWDAANLVFSAYKRAADGRANLLRLYENQGRATSARIRLPGARRARLAELDETPLEELPIADGAVTLTVPPYKAVTLLID